MGLNLNCIDGQTPLDEEERAGLLIKTITTRGELDEHEQLNIEKAIEWTVGKKFSEDKVLMIDFMKSLHKRMYSDVWKWAGEFRKSQKNLGIEWPKIEVELQTLLDYTLYWIKNSTYKPDEIAILFKHRLVSIHCFPNGNGRHSRLMADIIAEAVLGEEVFSWNQSNMTKPDEIRKQYINCLRQADNGNIKPLVEFARG